jgi:hypothetical protein
MEACVECTHCRVLMTSWAAPGSPVRYWQCPFCRRTHSSAYGEVFRPGGVARLISGTGAGPAAARPPPARTGPAAAEWAALKARALRWFERLDAEGRPPAERPRAVHPGPADRRDRSPGQGRSSAALATRSRKSSSAWSSSR